MGYDLQTISSKGKFSMDAQIAALRSALDAARRSNPNGSEFWMARDLQDVLGYSRWENFEDIIAKARMACESAGVDPNDHLLQTAKMIEIGKGAERERKDYFLSRYGCYLVAMNGDPSMPAIGVAQTYFAVQARKQELQEDYLALEKRAALRSRVSTANKALNDAAKMAGVQNYGLFYDAGYRGLYGMGLTQIKQRKKIEGDLLDHAGRAELAANEFRITQAEQKIVRENVKGEARAIATHKNIGEEVRQTIKKIGGTMPEDLPPEPSIKALLAPKKKSLKNPK